MRIALPPAIAIDAFAGLDPTARVTDLGGETMGTRWNVRCVLPPAMPLACLEAAIVARLAGLVAEMSHWDEASRLCAFNAAPVDSWTALPPDFAHVMARGLAIAAATDGAFDPAIGRLVDLWGFGPTPATAPPGRKAIADALACGGWERLALREGRLRQPGGLSLDLSGIAKGHAVDAVAALLTAMGVAHALVEIGGELAGRGVKPDGRPWWVDLEPPPGTDVAPLRIALHGIAVATSGDYVRGAHTIDPRTGHPVTNGVVSASVVHEKALDADAWATALTVLGREAGVALAEREGIAARIVTVADGAATEFLTAPLSAMLDG